MASADIHIRPFAPADLPGMFAVRRSAICDVAARDYNPAQIAAWVNVSNDHESRLKRFMETLTWVAEWNGEVIGFINLGAARPNAGGLLDCLYVHGAHQRKGAAKSLFRVLEAAAIDRGDQRLYSQVSLTARGFFERHGFAVRAPETVHTGGQDYLVFQMEKPLR